MGACCETNNVSDKTLPRSSIRMKNSFVNEDLETVFYIINPKSGCCQNPILIPSIQGETLQLLKKISHFP